MALVTLTADNFNGSIENNEIVIIDFWAPWCGPCRSFAPIYEKTSAKYPDIVFGKVNTEEEQALGGQFQIRSIPTTMMLKDGIIVFQQAGVLPESALIEIIGKVQELDMDMVRKEIEEQSSKSEN